LKIITENLIIRDISVDDAKEAFELFKDENAMRFLSLYPPLNNMVEVYERLNEWINEGTHYSIVSKENNTFIGYVAINPDSEEDREDTKELGFGLIEKYRHKGFMYEALSSILDYLKQEKIKYVWACCLKGNDDSRRLVEKLNFKLKNIGTYEVENDREYTSYEYRKVIK